MGIKEKLKECKVLIIILLSSLIILFGVIIYNACLRPSREVFAESANIKEVTTSTSDKESKEGLKISNANLIDIDAIIAENLNHEQDEYLTEEVELEYITKYTTNSQLPKGVVQVIQEGRTGKQEIIIKKAYQNGELQTEEQISSKVTKAAINKIVEIGTSNYTNSYKVKTGDIVYVTSDRIEVMLEPNEDSEKLATLERNTELKVLAIKDGWYQIISSSARGYVKAENTAYINKNEKNADDESTTGRKIENPSFEMLLNKPSGLSLEQFKKVLTDNKDRNKVFEKNAEYFYYIENQYSINGIFVAAVGIHESAWGTSKISNEKNNLFGYGAYDSNPYNGAYEFSDYSESIDLIARVFVKYYLNSKGTSIYGGEKAIGTYYNGATLSGVNTRYATDKNWANSVFNYMQYLYNKL